MALSAPFYRTLAAYHRAGMGWPEAVASAAGIEGGLEQAAHRVGTGMSLADALEGEATPLDRALLRAGETSGSLEQTLETLARTREEDEHHKKERASGLAYPVILAHVGALMLPLPDLFQGHLMAGLVWSACVLVPVWSWLLFLRYLDRAGGRGGERPLPSWGPFRNRADEGDARSLRVLSACVEAGVPLLEGLRLARGVAPGSRMGQDLARAEVLAQQGSALAAAWQDIAPEYARRLHASEEVGELGDAAGRIASELSTDVHARREKARAVLPLAMLLLVGGVIGLRVISFYAGLYGNLSRLSP